MVFADPESGEYFHFVDNQLLGHPNGLLATTDSLYLTDLSWIGALSVSVSGVNANEAGVIYRIMAVPEPSFLAVGFAVVAGLLGFRTLRGQKA